MKKNIFRMYDIRGIVGTELMIEQAYALGLALAAYYVHRNPHFKKVALGADGRIHSPALRAELERAFVDSGIDVEFVGWCPSPLLYYALHTRPVDGGVMITASHNGKEYNGFKISLGTESVWGNELQELASLYYQGASVKRDRRGIVSERPILKEYLACMKEKFPDLIGAHIPCVVDCGNGAGGYVMPALIKALELQGVELLYPEVDGTYPHHDADPTVAKNMVDVAEHLSKTGALFGLGLDGDCDRLGAMTKAGELIPGDKLLALFVAQIHKKYPTMAVVADSKCSSALTELMAAWGVRFIISPSGHSIIKQSMKEGTALLAGELSGHFFFKDEYFGYDDGIYAALRLLSILHLSGKSLDEFMEIFPVRYSTHEIRLDMPSDQASRVVQEIANHFACEPATSVVRIDGVRVERPHGWGLVRPSNTQPVICLRFESHSRAGLAEIITEMSRFLPGEIKDAMLSQAQECL